MDEDAEPALIENRAGALFVNNVNTGLCMNEAPDYVKSALRKQRRFSNTKTPADAPENKEEPKMAENKTTGAPAAPAITTVDALRTAYPDLVNQIENAAAQNATTAERARIKDIEDMTAPGDEQTAYDAKFGDKPQDAAAYAIACMKAQKARRKTRGRCRGRRSQERRKRREAGRACRANPKTAARTAQSPASAAPTT